MRFRRCCQIRHVSLFTAKITEFIRLTPFDWRRMGQLWSWTHRTGTISHYLVREKKSKFYKYFHVFLRFSLTADFFDSLRFFLLYFVFDAFLLQWLGLPHHQKPIKAICKNCTLTEKQETQFTASLQKCSHALLQFNFNGWRLIISQTRKEIKIPFVVIFYFLQFDSARILNHKRKIKEIFSVRQSPQNCLHIFLLSSFLVFLPTRPSPSRNTCALCSSCSPQSTENRGSNKKKCFHAFLYFIFFL